MIELTWSKSSDILGEGSLLTEGVQIEGSISGTLPERVQGSTVYLKNNSNIEDTDLSTAFDLGLYCKAYAEGYSFEQILEWSRLLDADDKPYGVFIVFGYDESDVSYIEKALDNSITAEELSKFHINYSQGRNFYNSIKLDVVNTFNEGSYSKTKNFKTFSVLGGAEPTTGDATGLLKVCILTRIPDSIDATRVLLGLSVSYEEA